MSAELLIDNSAWARLWDPGLDRSIVEATADAVGSGTIGVCLPFVLEAGYSARGAGDHRELIGRLLELPFLPIDAPVERRAIEAQEQLARAGHHRLPPVDLLIAAIADRHGLGVLHYDSDYDSIAARTDLRFESRWLVPRGAL